MATRGHMERYALANSDRTVGRARERMRRRGLLWCFENHGSVMRPKKR